MTSVRSLFSRVVLLGSCCLLSCLSTVHAQNTVTVVTPKDAWQLRRDETAKTFLILMEKKAGKAEMAAASKKADQILTEFDSMGLPVTPMEAMDLIAWFYVPQGDEPALGLIMISMQATLGWYDALRFADSSGLAEILGKERFFNKALMAKKDMFFDFMKQQPKEAAEAVATGIGLARQFKDLPWPKNFYNEQWPASYGLLRMQCGLKKLRKCAVPQALPESEWPAAMEEAVKRVTHYYRIDS